LTTIFIEEQQKRRGRFATRATGTGRTTVTAERFLARKRDAWEAFRASAQRLEKGGLSRLPAAEIPGFAARYREVAADLARARTYGVDPQVVAYLERLVGAGHNVLYQARTVRRAPFARYVLNDFPAAVVQSWRPVLASCLLFMVPAVVGFVMLRERPQLAEEIVSPVMVSRAEQAAERQAEGLGYAQAETGERPVIAAAIISNNIRVCILAFAGGMLGGVLTVFALVYNGLAIGTGFGVFANYGAAGYLGTFVAGHGVLELTAIFISGGAGFRLAHALIAPGDRTRLDALVVDGRIAMRMLGAVVFLLAIAGSIEGLLSASDAPAAWKVTASVASAVFLGLYFLNGYRCWTGETRGGLPDARTTAASGASTTVSGG
ncbi:MAG: stage II sporulation protein M, partial [Gemmatimonadales bacterium]